MIPERQGGGKGPILNFGSCYFASIARMMSAVFSA